MTEEEIKKHHEVIDSMGRKKMAWLWRTAPAGHIYFDNTLPLFEYFKDRFDKLGGFNTVISKDIRW